MPRGERRHSKASDGGSSMDTSFTTVGGHPYYQYHGGGGGGSGQQQHPPPHQMSHHRGRQHPQRAPSPMMVSSPTPPYLPPHYGDPNLPPYYPIQQTPGASSSGHHQHQHHIPIHSAQPPQPLISGSAYQQPPPYYPVQQSYPLPPPPPTANTTPTNAMPPIGGTSGGTGDSIMGGAVAGSAGNSDPLVQQDIERGLRIDFYSETDAMLLASWASFFRDQFLEARQELAKASFDRNAETYRRATHFVERVETKILKTNAMKQLFRRHPLTNINDPIFVDACYRVIIDYLMRNPPFDGFAFGNPTWRDYMWFRAGLMKVVEDGRNKFLEWYTKKISETVDLFIQMGSDETTRGQELLEATQSAMKSETSYHQAKQFYIRLFNDVLSKIEQQDGTTVDLSIAGRRVREVFHLDEEALILSAIMSHIIDKEITFKGDHQEGKPPTPQDVGTGVQGGATTLLKILATAMDISQLLASQELSYTMDAPILILTQDEDDVAAQNKMGYVEQEPKGAGKVEEETTASPSS